MKKIIFIMLISLSFQGMAQIENGVYKSNSMKEHSFIDCEYISTKIITQAEFYIHISDCAFRVYSSERDAGQTYPYVYIGVTKDGYEMYGASPDDRLEYKDGELTLFYNFSNASGCYDTSIVYDNLQYHTSVPDLLGVYEESEKGEN